MSRSDDLVKLDECYKFSFYIEVEGLLNLIWSFLITKASPKCIVFLVDMLSPSAKELQSSLHNDLISV